jgi:hypothetical protein
LEKFKILKICLNSYENLRRLRQFHTIIEFTNTLLPKFNHMVTREAARSTPIKRIFTDNEEGRQLRAQYQEFMKAWNSLDIDELKWECKSPKYVRYTEDSELINFLVDVQEVGNGMCMAAAIQNLSEAQNGLLNILVNQYALDRKLDPNSIISMDEPHNPQRLKKEHILNIDLEDPTLLQGCSINNYLYGGGQSLLFDYSRIEVNIVTSFRNCKRIQPNEIEFIQYQLEILGRNGKNS